MKTIFCITGLAIQGLAMSVQAQTGKPCMASPVIQKIVFILFISYLKDPI